MNREIKFRAWDLENKKYLWTGFKRHTSESHEDKPQNIRKGNFHLTPYWVERQVVFQQFTGLHDKNGKEIYEGDIIRQGGDLCIVQSCVGGFDCQMLIELKNGGTIEGSTYNFSFLSETYCEIIGNIYENPELCNP